MNTDIISAITDVLQNIKSPGDFYVEGSRRMPPPLLKVSGLGPIAFPLIPLQAEQLRALCEAAPYGRGDQTLVDRGVRRTWQLSTDQFSLEDPDFQGLLQSFLDEIRTRLGISGRIHAQPYKLLLYDEGSFFLPHRDTEKAHGMFGTLVIALPSVFAGGELVVRHAGREVVLPMSATLPGELRFAAFYADCEHEVRPVTNGYRLVLIYNLVVEERQPLPHAPHLTREIAQVTDLLTHWAASTEEPDKLLYVLSHRYSSAGLSWHHLKNGDAGAASVLKVAAEQAGCTLSLAMISIQEQGGAEYVGNYRHRYRRWYEADGPVDDSADFEVIEVYERTERVGEWRDVHDQPMVLEPLEFSPEELCPPDALEGAKPDEQSFSEATGNEGGSFERTYRFAALVLWPNNRFIQLLAQAEPHAALSRLEFWLTQPDETSRASALELAQRLLPNWNEQADNRPFPSRTIQSTRFLQVLVALQRPELLIQLMRLILNKNAIRPEGHDMLARALIFLGVEEGGPLLRSMVEAWGVTSFDACGLLLAHPAFLAAPGWHPILVTAWHDLLKHMPGVEKSNAFGRFEPRSPQLLARLLTALVALEADSLVKELCRHLTQTNPGTPGYTVDKTVWPLLQALPATLQAHPKLAPLREHTLAHFRARIALPLAPPSDQRRDANIQCSCEDCRALTDFLQSPTRAHWAYAVNQARRTHLERKVEEFNCDVRCHTLHQGSPHSLVFEKTTASYLARCRQREADLKAVTEIMGFRGP